MKVTPAKFSTQVFPWEIQPNETKPAYDAFVLYRDMGAERSQVKVSQSCGKHPTLIQRWSRRWRWQWRLEQWERYLDRIRVAEIAKQTREAARRHLSMSLLFQQKIIERLPAIPVAGLTFEECRKALETSVKVERLSLGMVTERVSSTTPDESTQSSEQNDLPLDDPEIIRIASELSARIANKHAQPGATSPDGAGGGG